VHTTPHPQDIEIIFRPSLHRFLCLLAAVLGAGGAGLFQALAVGALWGWALALAALAAGTTLAARFAGRAVILCGDELIVCTGALRVREVSLPLWLVRLEVRRSLFGVWGDYGTVLLHAGETTLVVPHLGQLHALRHLLATRRRLLLQHAAPLRALPQVWAAEHATLPMIEG
jgi:hypothetical protein